MRLPWFNYGLLMMIRNPVSGGMELLRGNRILGRAISRFMLVAVEIGALSRFIEVRMGFPGQGQFQGRQDMLCHSV